MPHMIDTSEVTDCRAAMHPPTRLLLLLLIGAAGCGSSDAREPSVGDASNVSIDAVPVAGPCMPTASACPNYTVSATDVSCSLNNTASIDLVQDSRLDFGDGPDDAIAFTAPVQGDYAIWLESEPSTNDGCGVSAANASKVLHTPADCPSAGATVDLDGFYAGFSEESATEYPVTIAAGEEILLVVGCTTWADAQSGPYELRIKRL